MDKTIKCNSCNLGSCAIYALSEKELKDLEVSKYQSNFKKGELLRKQDTPTEFVLYLRKGYIKEYLRHDNLPDQVIQLIKPRSYIGIQETFTDTISAFSYQAITDSEVCFIEKSKFSDIFTSNGTFAREILISISKETISNHKRFLGINQTQIFGKVAGLLIYLSEDVYEQSTFELHLTRAELAQMIAATRESVSRALKWFDKEGIISTEKQWITIKDDSKLHDIAKRG